MRIEERIERIQNMERCFDEVCAALGKGIDSKAMREKIRLLMDYMDGGQWLADYASDERGELPADLKRGVLSEDALYNLLTEIEERDGKTESESAGDE